MFKIRMLSIVLALVLSAATLAPRTTLAWRAGRSSPEAAPTYRTSAARTQAAPQANSSDEGVQGQPKRRSGGFARALGAPFRAIARLFGGGKKSSGEEAKTRKASQPQTTAAADTTVAASNETSPAPEPPKRSADAAAAGAVHAQAKQDSAHRAVAVRVDKTKVKTRARAVALTPEPSAVASVNEVEPPPPVPAAPAVPAAALVNENKLKTVARKVDVNERLAAARGPEVMSPSELPPAPASAPEVETPAAAAAVAPRPGEGARVVRPDVSGSFVEPPKLWVPVIEGIPKDPLTQGRALLEHGYVQEAISELSVAATQVGPNIVEANNLLGIAYDRVGLHKQAADAYNRALTISPGDANVLANLGYSLYLADDYAGALKRLKQAAKLAPGQPVIYNNLGIVTARVGKYDEAYKYFVIASNDYDAHLKLAAILEDQQRDRDAIKHYEAALAMQPGASAILERLVALYERTGERDKADTARRALGQPKNPQKTTTGGGG